MDQLYEGHHALGNRATPALRHALQKVRRRLSPWRAGVAMRKRLLGKQPFALLMASGHGPLEQVAPAGSQRWPQSDRQAETSDPPAADDSPSLGKMSQLGPHPHPARSTMLTFSLISRDCWGGVAERKPAVGALTREPRLMRGRVGLAAQASAPDRRRFACLKH